MFAKLLLTVIKIAALEPQKATQRKMHVKMQQS